MWSDFRAEHSSDVMWSDFRAELSSDVMWSDFRAEHMSRAAAFSAVVEAC